MSNILEKADKITKGNKNDRKIVNFEIEINLRDKSK